MAPKAMAWTDGADRKLLLFIIKHRGITVDNEAAAKEMSTDEVTVTASAIQNRIKKLKAMAKGDGAGDATGGDGDGTPKPKGKGRKRALDVDADDEESPAAKKTKATKGTATKGRAYPSKDEKDCVEEKIKEEEED